MSNSERRADYVPYSGKSLILYILLGDVSSVQHDNTLRSLNAGQNVLLQPLDIAISFSLRHGF
jgi:hypothetical protein